MDTTTLDGYVGNNSGLAVRVYGVEETRTPTFADYVSSVADQVKSVVYSALETAASVFYRGDDKPDTRNKIKKTMGVGPSKRQPRRSHKVVPAEQVDFTKKRKPMGLHPGKR